MLDYGLILGAATAIFWSVSNVLAKRASIAGTNTLSLLMAVGGAMPIFIPLAFHMSGISAAGFVIAALAGIAMIVGNLFFYKALETQQASNAYGMSVVQAILIGFFGVVLLGNQLTYLQLAGAFVGMAGVLMVATSGCFRLNKLLMPAIAGNVVWAIGWGLAGYAIKYSANTFVVLSIGRAFAIAGLLIIYARLGGKARMPKLKTGERNVVLWTGIVAGILSGAGSVTLGELAALGNFAIGGILTSFVPVGVAVLAYFAYHDRLTRTQAVGILVATAGAAMIAM